MNSKAKIAIMCAALICAVVVSWITAANRRSVTTLTYSQFLERVRTGQMANVIVLDSNAGAPEAQCRLKNGIAVRTVLPSDYRDAIAAMQDKLVNVEIRDSRSRLPRLVLNATPVFLLLCAWIFLMIRKFPHGLGRAF